MALRDLPDDGQEIGCRQRYGQPGALGCRPQPVDGAIRHPGTLMRLIEREAEAEHSWPLLPAVDQPAILRAIKGEVAQDGEPVRVLTCSLDGQFVGIGVPARRMD